MPLNVCPADTVHAPVGRVWDLLMHPVGYGRFWDFTVDHVEPEGPAVVEQMLFGWSRTLGRRCSTYIILYKDNPRRAFRQSAAQQPLAL